jgi:hypothetical protein
MSAARRIGVVAGVVVALLLFALLGGFAWFLYRHSSIQNPLLWTAALGALGWAIRSSVEQKREYRRLMADKKREHYIQFLDFFSRFIASSQKEEKGQEVSLEEFRRWSLLLTMIGSDEVVRRWNAARSTAGTLEHVAMLKVWGDLWLAMRKDCGHPDTSLDVADMLTSFVNDIEKYRDELRSG